MHDEMEPMRGEDWVTLLLVSPLIDDHISLRSIVNRSRWRLYDAFSCADAIAVLRKNPIPVVICASTLPGGTWLDLFEEAGKLPFPPRFIVASRVADGRLWSEVLSVGAYDLLVTPFAAAEVFRVGFLAWHSWRDAHEKESKKTVAPAQGNVAQVSTLPHAAA